MPLITLTECLAKMSHHFARGMVRAVTTSCANHGTSRGFYFVSASYQGRSLLSAATELALTVREAMGPDRPPHLVTLFATPHSEWGAALADTPQYVRELLTYQGVQPPVIVGGVLRSVGAGASCPAKEGDPCVALLAAHLPGVRIMPFHTTKSSLPALPGDGWAEVVRAARAFPSTAAVTAVETATTPTGLGAGAFSPTVPAGEASTFGSACTSPQGAAGTDAAMWARLGTAAPGDAAAPSAEERAAEEGLPAAGHAAACGIRSGEHATSRPSIGGKPAEVRYQLKDQQAGQQKRLPQQQMELPNVADAKLGVLISQSKPRPAASPGKPGPLGNPARVAPAAPGSISSVATLLLSAPHFVEVEELLKRFGQVAPGMQVIGGVTSPGAWSDSESNWGAVWLNDRTYAQGAVGCVLHGPFKLDTIVSPGFQGAGPVMRVTQAHGQYVLELDGEPVQRPLQRAIAEALNSGEFASSLKIGLGDATAVGTTTTVTASSSSNCGSGSDVQHRSVAATAQYSRQQRQQAVSPSQPALHHAAAASGSGSRSSSQQQQQQLPAQQSQAPRQLVTRNWFFQQGPPRPFMTVQSSAPIAVGTPIQVHLQNYPAAHRHMRDQLRKYAERLPTSVTAAEGAVGSLALSCSALPFSEAPDVARCLPGAAFAGGKLEGEICSTVEGQPSRLHSFTSCLAFLRASIP